MYDLDCRLQDIAAKRAPFLSPVYRTQAYVERDVESLAEQLAQGQCARATLHCRNDTAAGEE